LTGKHAARRTRGIPLGPLATAAVVAAVLVGGAIGVHRLGAVDTASATPSPAASNVPTAGTTRAPAVTPPTTAAAPTSSARPTPSRSGEHASRSTTRTSRPSPTPTKSTAAKVVDSGTCEASFYSEAQPTANGEQFDPDAMTAAHKSLPFDTRVRVTNLSDGRSVIVRINDRGPYVDGRCLDLSRAAFEAIAPLDAGVATVRYEVLAG
jgi:rare lipoprotein A